MHKFNSKVERVNLSNFCNFQPFASNNKGSNSIRKLGNRRVAKTLMSPYTVCFYFEVFKDNFYESSFNIQRVCFKSLIREWKAWYVGKSTNKDSPITMRLFNCESGWKSVVWELFLSILLHEVILFFIPELKSCKSKLRSSNSMHISDDDCSVLSKTNFWRQNSLRYATHSELR